MINNIKQETNSKPLQLTAITVRHLNSIIIAWRRIGATLPQFLKGLASVLLFLQPLYRYNCYKWQKTITIKELRMAILP